MAPSWRKYKKYKDLDSIATVGGCPRWETCVDKLESRHPSGIEPIQEPSPNEAVYKVVAYSSGYLFWLTVIGLSAGIVLNLT